MITHPEIAVTPDYPVIKIREPRESTDLAKELPKILHSQGWGIGTFFHVQFINHGRTELLATALFVVSGETEELQTNEANPNQPMTRMVQTRKYDQIGEWWTARGLRDLEGKIAEVMADVMAMSIKWNVGSRAYDIYRGEERVMEGIATKEEAQAIARGEPAKAA